MGPSPEKSGFRKVAFRRFPLSENTVSQELGEERGEIRNRWVVVTDAEVRNAVRVSQ
jgi:hypothetical protein